ncbi:GTPase [Alienimonas californiensis]|uniref:tRNA modification GTPase MnmE n=1 Tax=Alienimonas californiensis TaxID=2527989 RepID=A0A517P6E4_9PLAN|nr:GTPase [Alienimonas californiensis]QDT14932.1 tRNA modification GTPase MnmE [Alienimonas californiensis]
MSARPTAALLTPPGRGAVAVIRVVGPPTLCDAAFAAANGRPVSAQPLNRVAFGRWGRDESERRPGEELIVVRTAADETEIHGHGGRAAIDRIFADLAAAGVERVGWEEQEHARSGELPAELAAALAAAPTVRCAGVILDQISGTLARGLADPSQHAAMRERIEFGRHLTEPWLVVIAGPPNAGKSSLLNAIAGYGRALVSPIAGTTRDAVGATIAVDGWPVRLTDTAGLRETLDPLEAAGVAKARATLADADAVIQLADGSAAEEIAPLPPHRRTLRAWNKLDRPDVQPTPPGWLGVSAETGAGVPALLAALSQLLIPAPPPPGEPVPLTPRQATLILP